MPLLIMGKDHGHSSIQINKLQDLFFQSKDLNTPAGFKRKWPGAGLEGTTKHPYFLNDFKIFVVMDTDDCNEETLQKFKDRSLFAGHWAYEWIVPVFNTENLEDVMERTGLPFTKKGIERKKEYSQIVPGSIDGWSDLASRLRKDSKTNLEEPIEHILLNRKVFR